MAQATYAKLMSEGTPFIELRIYLSEPPDLLDLIGAFAAVGHQFEQYVARQYPKLQGEARLFVKEIRQGSIILDLIPHIPGLIATMDAVLIVDNFVTRYRGLLAAFIGGESPTSLSKSDTKDFLDTVRLVAKDKKGSAIISSAVFKQEGAEKHIEFQFSTQEAQQAQELLERKMIEHDRPIYETFQNVLMTFWQSNVADPPAGKKTTEKAVIEALHPKPLAITYETDEVRERIKYETREDERNLYQKGFFVDCHVERLRGRPVAYRITAVRDVIDLPGDEDDKDSSPRLV